jgi:cyanate lyase
MAPAVRAGLAGAQVAWRRARGQNGELVTTPISRGDATAIVQDALARREMTFAELARRLDRPRLWVAAATLGQHPFSADEATKLVGELGLDPALVPILQQIPIRGALQSAVPVDPTIYRLYEILQVYGPAIKALIHEEFGDGIMSAINFRADVERVQDPAGDRVKITLDGKFLPYQWD